MVERERERRDEELKLRKGEEIKRNSNSCYRENKKQGTDTEMHFR
jgi:hypothetical protein